MSLPFFFFENITPAGTDLVLDEESSKHIVQVLRMQDGEKLLLTDGKGRAAEATIANAHKKHCTVTIISSSASPEPIPKLTIAISLIKSVSRFEWFLEKATELGIFEIIPLICDRTEKQHSRHDRFLSICKSAMLQSSQVWLPIVHHPRPFMEVVETALQDQKIIAHCTEDNKRSLSSVLQPSLHSHIILIGPEGDFSDEEVEVSKSKGFEGVSLGKTRLRTETAGIFAAVIHASQSH